MRIRTIIAAAAVAALSTVGFAGTAAASDLSNERSIDVNVPGHQGRDGDEMVVSQWITGVYYEDADGNYFWVIGDGRVYGSPGVTTLDDLDPETTVTYDYVVVSKGQFGDDPGLDNGVIFNRIKGDDGSIMILRIVHNTHPSYTGEGIPEYQGEWEYTVLATNGVGNIVKNER